MLPLHTAGPLGGHHSCVYRPGEDAGGCWEAVWATPGGRSAPSSPQTMVLASGGQDGAICLWDVLTGSRVSHMFAHRGDVTSLTCTTSCVISSGLDDLICIWDRSTGIKLYSIQQVGRGRVLSQFNKGDSRH